MTPASAQVTLSPNGCCTTVYQSYAATVTGNAGAPTSIALTNPSTGDQNGQWSLGVTINPGDAVTGGQPYAYNVVGIPVVDTVSSGENAVRASYANGPNITSVTNNATLTLNGVNPVAGPMTVTSGSDTPSVPFLTYPSGSSWNNALLANALQVMTYGADGYLQGGNKTPPNSTVYSGAPAGLISITNNGQVLLTANAPSSAAAQAPWLPYASAIGAYAMGGGGAGGKVNDNDIGGDGGAGGQITINNNAQITVSGNGQPGLPVNGITAYSQGGTPGCRCSGSEEQFGSSGNGGPVTVINAAAINSTASNSIGISAMSVGGNGGLLNGTGIAAMQGTSGAGGDVTVTLQGGGSINMTGGSGVGVLAASSVGPSAQSNTTNAGGTVNVTINSGVTVASTGGGTFNIGVAAVSTGSPNILQPFSSNYTGSDGSGASGQVNVTNSQGATITTNGQLAIGIAALSIGGGGVFSGTSASSTMGNTNTSAPNFTASAVNVTNAGTITTNGGSAFGVLAMANGSGGLLNILSNVIANSDNVPTSLSSNIAVGGAKNSGSTATNNGNGGGVSVTNTGSITTGDGNGGGVVAIGILAQSIGGGGGTTGGGGVPFLVGAQGGNAGYGGAVSVTNSGNITTYDEGAIGILAQSVGGGGGNGGNAYGLFVAIGGSGGNGGNGDTVTVNLTSGQISTSGDYAAGTIAQSIGGGGGNGGTGTSIGLFVNDAIGGTAGSGGGGGTIAFTNAATMNTQGQHSFGLLAQSVGGGGGNGGAASAYTAGAALTVSIAVGGSGGTAGAGGTISLTNSGQIVTTGPDSIGVLAHSVGGGGGNGGAASSKLLSFSGDEIPSISFNAALGGKSGAAGDGGNVTINNTGVVSTDGAGAHGMLAQSIGGGGGNGGDSTAATKAVAAGSPQINMTAALGANGGNGGSGGTVDVYAGAFGGSSFTIGGICVPTNGATSCSAGSNTASPGGSTTLSTGGDNAPAIAAQSIGGGGGNATLGNATNSSSDLGDSDTYTLSASVGAKAGTGGTGGTVNVATNGGTTLTTTGSGSPGIIAQSIAGGGGISLGGSYGASLGFTATVNAGGNGVAGANSGNVTVVNAGNISTSGGDAIGILAQSISGGGGVVGSSDPAASTGGDSSSSSSAGSSKASALATRSSAAPASLSSSGSSESGDSSDGDSETPPKTTYSATVTIGGNGGGGGTGGTVQVANSGAITTQGVRAYGIEAQSIGGGGGNGASATSTADATDGTSASANVSVGGQGGVAGAGGTVTVYSSGAIATSGFNAHGILAQSIGGGGGVGGDGSVNQNTTTAIGAGINGGGGGGGNGGNVTVTTATGGTISTAGDDATGMLVQSIGGGGGTATAGCGSPKSGNSYASCVPANVVTNTYSGNYNYSINVGGVAGASGGGSTTLVTAGDKITTTGARSMGIVAQSIGGGGGFSTASAETLNGTTLSQSPGSNSGTGGPVTVTLNASIATSGAGSWGILAQSIGGGGGFAGDPSLNLTQLQSNTLSQNQGDNGYANTVNVNVNGNITTAGANAHGIFAQTIGGSGGIVAGGGNSTSATVAAGNAAQIRNTTNSTNWGESGAINITQAAGTTISTSGAGSIGIIAQASGNNQTSQSISIKLGGAVIGGTNNGYSFANGGIGAAGILVSGGGLSASTANTITLDSGAFLSTADNILNGSTISVPGTAIIANSGVTNVSNSGTIAGIINVSSGTVTNNAGGTIYSGGSPYVGIVNNGGAVFNYGSILNQTGGGAGVENSGQLVNNAGATIGGNGLGVNNSASGVATNNGTINNGVANFGQFTNGATGVVNNGFTNNSGGTVVNSGQMNNGNVTNSGTFNNNGTIGGNFTNTPGGTLSGNGTIAGNHDNNGQDSPGNSIGRITVGGNLTHRSGATYQVEVTGSGQSDQIKVAGTASLQGGAINVAVLPGGAPMAPRTTYTILTAAGGVSGSYGSLTSPYPFLQPSLSADANNVYLTMTIGGFAAAAQTPTQAAVGAALDAGASNASGDFANILGGLATLNASQVMPFLTSISGQNYSAFSNSMVQGAQLFMNNFALQVGGGSAPGGRGRVAIAEACVVACQTTSPALWGAWGGVLGGTGTVGAGTSTGSTTYNVGGFAAGLDRRFAPNFLAGVTVGYTTGTQWVSGFSGQSATNTFQVGLYGSFFEGPFYLDGMASYAYSTNQMWRNIAIPSLQQRTAQGLTGANQFFGQIEGGYRIDLGGTAQAFITPFARLQGYTGTQNGFTETGAQSLSLTVASQTTTSLRSVIGAQLGGSMDLGWRDRLHAQFRLGWSHEFADVSRPVTASLAGAPGFLFTTYGSSPQRDGAVVGLSLTTSIADASSLYLRYEGNIAGQDSTHALTAGFRMTW